MEYLTRLTHNLNDWTCPSGAAHKAKGSTAFEAIYDFGFEEWLFCKRHQSDGFQYGYIEGLNTFFGNRKPLEVPLILFTLKYSQNRTRPASRLLVAKIRKWEFLTNWKGNIPDPNTQEEWRSNMIADLANVLKGQRLIDAQNQIGIHYNALPDVAKPLFNIRFSLKSSNVCRQIVSVSDTSALRKLNRFKLYDAEEQISRKWFGC